MIERLIEFSLVYLSAIVSPGPNFIMVVRTGLSHSFYNGFSLVLGLCFGSLIQISLALLGIEMVFSQYPGAIKIIQYSGAAFLAYMGATALFSQKKPPVLSTETGISSEAEKHFWKFFRLGIMTQLLNPFAIIFNWSVFVAFKSDIVWINGLYMASALLIEFLWYAGLAWFLARPGFQKAFRGYHHWIERGAGALLIVIAFRIAFTKI